MDTILKPIGEYVVKLFSDQSGKPSCKRYMCAIFGITSIVLAVAGYEVTLVGIFVAAAVGENVTSVFEKRQNT